MLLGRVNKRKPGFPFMPVGNQGGGSGPLSINQNDDQLAPALFCSVVRARAIGMSMAGFLQIKSQGSL